MKKILALLFVVAIACMAFACGSGNGKNTTGKTNASMNTTMGGLLPGTHGSTTMDGLLPGTDMTTMATKRTTAATNGTSASTNTNDITGATSNTNGTNGTITPSTGGGTTVR